MEELLQELSIVQFNKDILSKYMIYDIGEFLCIVFECNSKIANRLYFGFNRPKNILLPHEIQIMN